MNKQVKDFINKGFNEYLSKEDWRVKENSNAAYSLGALSKHISSRDTAIYWQEYYDKFNPEIIQGHKDCRYHIHDLGFYSSYCYGASLEEILKKGIKGVPNVSDSSAPKHFRSATSIIANITTIFQNEVAGAVAFSSWNTYLAPFIYFDKLERDQKIAFLFGGVELYNVDPYKQKVDLEYHDLDIDDIKQSIQNMIFALNSNSRAGAEPAFSNLTLDFKVLKPMQDKNVIIAGKEVENFVYKDFQKEADMLLDLFSQCMNQGDANGHPFAYPIPTFNISKNVEWDNPSYKYVWEMSGKYGIPYFANFIHGDLSEDDIRSMCCRLRLDKRELMKKTGGLFGAGEQTGSIGVFTISLPMIAYKHKNDKEAFFKELKELMELGKQQLILKRGKVVEEFNNGLYPALKEYTHSLDTMFLTMGMIGANEMCTNFFDNIEVDITSRKGIDFTEEVMNFMLEAIKDFQEETGLLFNLEATPAEGATYRLASGAKKHFRDIYVAGEGENVYFTNSVHLPVYVDWLYNDIFKHQEKLLSKFTGGSVYHRYLIHSLSGDMVKEGVKTIFTNFNIPYLSNSPLYSICNVHGYLEGKNEICPHCGMSVDTYQRVTGYIRKVNNFNKGKTGEFNNRFQKTEDLF